MKLALANSRTPPPREPSLSECFAHTDLEWRLAQIPPDAAVRGVFFTMLDRSAASFGPETHAAYREFFRTWDFSAIRFYPVRDYVTRLVLLAQMRYGAEHIARGLFEIQSGAYAAWRSTLMGKAMFQLLRGNLLGALQTTERAYAAHVVTYCGSHSRRRRAFACASRPSTSTSPRRWPELSSAWQACSATRPKRRPSSRARLPAP